MMIPSTEDLTEFVRRIVEAESTLYRQKQALKQARRELEMQRPMLELGAGSVAIPFYPADAPLNYRGLVVTLLCLAVSLTILLLGERELEFILCAACFLAAAVVVYVMYHRARASRDRDRLLWEMEVEQLQQELEQERSHRESRFQRVSEMLSGTFDLAIAETESSLDELYAAAFIAPEHRDLASMCSLYEQLLSGHRPNAKNFAPKKPAGDLDSLLNAPESIAEMYPTLSRELQKAKKTGDRVSNTIRRMLTGDEEVPIESIILLTE